MLKGMKQRCFLAQLSKNTSQILAAVPTTVVEHAKSVPGVTQRARLTSGAGGRERIKYAKEKERNV